MPDYAKTVVEDIGTHYKLEGDDFWYERCIGGKDIPLLNIGGDVNPDPRVIYVPPLDHILKKPDPEKMSLLEKLVREENGFTPIKPSKK